MGVAGAVTTVIVILLVGLAAQQISLRYENFERRMRRLEERRRFHAEMGGDIDEPS